MREDENSVRPLLIVLDQRALPLTSTRFMNLHRDLRTKTQHSAWLADDREPKCVWPSPSSTFPHDSLSFLSYLLSTVGGDCIYEPALAARFKERYPERKNLAEGA